MTQIGRELVPLVLAALGLGALYQAGARPVQVVVDGEPQLLRTHARQVGGVLDETGLSVGEHDRVSPGPDHSLSWSMDQPPTLIVQRARPVSLAAGDQRLLLHSPEASADMLLSHAGWMFFPGDRLYVDGLPAADAHGTVDGSVRLHPAVELNILEQGAQRTIYSAAPTLGAALAEAGLAIRQGDRVSPQLHTPLESPLTVEIVRGQPLVVRSGSTVMRAHSAAPTVAEALAEAGLELVGLDYTRPPAEGPLPADGQIQVVRVTETVTLELEPLPFETVYQPLDSLEIDQQQVIQAGAYGVRSNRIRVRLEDGQEVSRQVEGEWIAQEPSPQIVGYGTRIELRTISTADGPLEYWRAVEMYATSYSPSRAGVSPDAPWFGITASGQPLEKGLVAIDRSLIPFGTQMYVPGYGFAEAADTGSGVKGRWIDLGYEDHNWVSWSGYVTVYFLTPVPSNIVYIFP